MISLRFWIEPVDRDLLTADLWEAGTVGITEEEDGLRAFFDPGTDERALLDRLAAWEPEVEFEPERDWVAETRAAWQPFAVGERFYLVPEWRDDAAPEGRVRLRIHPGMACGTGTAPATQLCLLALERWLGTGAARTVLDVGTGTGILADAARLLGAERVIACDIEHEAAGIARENLPQEVGVFTGSVRSVKSGAIGVVVANLNATALVQNAAELLRLAAPEPLLILSGFQEVESARVARGFGRPVRDRLTMEGAPGECWCCLVL